MKFFTLFLFIALAAFVPVATAQTDLTEKVETTAQHDARMEWWHEAKFGMFVHFLAQDVHEFNPVDFKMFTVPLQGEGIMPGRMLSVDKFNLVGQALIWDFRLVEPGTYEVAVVSIGSNAKGRLRVTVAGLSVENALHEREKMKTIELASDVQESLAVLGTVTITAPGMQTLTLAVASDFAGSASRIRAVKLLPVATKK